MSGVERYAVFVKNRAVEVGLLGVDILLHKAEVEFCISVEVIEKISLVSMTFHGSGCLLTVGRVITIVQCCMRRVCTGRIREVVPLGYVVLCCG